MTMRSSQEVHSAPRVRSSPGDYLRSALNGGGAAVFIIVGSAISAAALAPHATARLAKRVSYAVGAGYAAFRSGPVNKE